MKLGRIFESPKYTFPQEFNLDDESVNIKTGKELMNDSRKEAIKAIGDYTLYAFPRAYALIHNDSKYVAYLMKYEVNFHKFLQRQCASQVLVWRAPVRREAIDLARYIFWSHLLPSYKTIITDSVQTPDGERFWGNRLTEAFANGIYVYYVSFIPNREVIQIHNENEFLKIRTDKDIWGDESKHQGRRIIITSKELSDI